MRKTLEEKLRYAVENDKLKYEKFFGKGCKWYNYYLEIWELVWARNLRDGYQIFVYDSENKQEHYGTFLVDYVPTLNGGYCLYPQLTKYA
ncbi:MAG: hypothetical protein LBP85_06650 [Prevotellaceae bacterium]|jgi:hypothetical protein|nr:hypothetical protein [Prevotellaceae bacterium]